MKHLFFSLLFVFAFFPKAYCQKFDEVFENMTLRIDYFFTGNSKQQSISIDELISLPGWAGRRHALNEFPLEGNGQITMKDKASGTVIYRTAFSSLFQEWLGEKEAQTVSRGFENTFLLPYPKHPALVTIELKNAHRETCASLTHEINPEDILIHPYGHQQVTPHQYLLKNGSPEKCIDIAIMAEGYTREEMDLFLNDAKAACDALFSHEPFKTLKNHFNVVAVNTVSQESGVSVPRNNDWKNTATRAHFDTFYSDRYLTTRNIKAIHNWLAGIPYEHIIILANTETYGGGGIFNAYLLTAARHDMFKPVVVHEFGHSFGGLADEYAYTEAPSPLYPYNIEPWEPNITTLVDFEKKWKDMLPPDITIPTQPETDADKLYTKIGVYEGAGYSLKGIYRPTTECRMKINEAPRFCPVCIHSLEKLIHFYTE